MFFTRILTALQKRTKRYMTTLRLTPERIDQVSGLGLCVLAFVFINRREIVETVGQVRGISVYLRELLWFETDGGLFRWVR